MDAPPDVNKNHAQTGFLRFFVDLTQFTLL
jgi:hypothetical protein